MIATAHGGRSPPSSGPTRSPTCRSTGIYARGQGPRDALRRLLSGEYPLENIGLGAGKGRFEQALPLVKL